MRQESQVAAVIRPNLTTRKIYQKTITFIVISCWLCRKTRNYCFSLQIALQIGFFYTLGKIEFYLRNFDKRALSVKILYNHLFIVVVSLIFIEILVFKMKALSFDVRAIGNAAKWEN